MLSLVQRGLIGRVPWQAWHDSKLLVDRMKNAGWCPTAIATLLKGQQIHNLFSASTLGSPPVLRDHSKNLHSDCVQVGTNQRCYLCPSTPTALPELSLSTNWASSKPDQPDSPKKSYPFNLMGWIRRGGKPGGK